jgi:hypothetical protein
LEIWLRITIVSIFGKYFLKTKDDDAASVVALRTKIEAEWKEFVGITKPWL